MMPKLMVGRQKDGCSPDSNWNWQDGKKWQKVQGEIIKESPEYYGSIKALSWHNNLKLWSLKVYYARPRWPYIIQVVLIINLFYMERVMHTQDSKFNIHFGNFLSLGILSRDQKIPRKNWFCWSADLLWFSHIAILPLGLLTTGCNCSLRSKWLVKAFWSPIQDGMSTEMSLNSISVVTSALGCPLEIEISNFKMLFWFYFKTILSKP